MHKTAKHSNRHHKYDLSDDVEKIKAALADATWNAKDRAGEMLFESFDNAKEKSLAMQDNVVNYVTKKPFKSLGIAVFTGILLGYFLRK